MRCNAAWIAAAALALAGCATTTGPDVTVDYDRTADLGSFRTYGFPESVGTDRAGYSTLVTSYFKSAVRDQMEMRGYRYVDQNPDLLVNFYAKVHERTEVRTDPSFSAAYGYYGYRYGLYSAWPYYDDAVRTVTYPVGTANIDVVDARRKQMIWEGVAQGVVSDEDMDHPKESISRVVTQLFARYPGRAGIVENSRQ